MGLEGVELVMEVERRFGITIPDSEAGKLATVGDLARLIDERMAAKTRSICPTMVGFLAVRSLIREVVANPGLRLRPTTPVASIVPVHSRRRFWQRAKAEWGIPLPPLELTRGSQLVLLTICAISVAAGVSTAIVDPAILPLGITLASVAMFVAHWSMGWWRTEVPASFATVGSFAQSIAGLSAATVSPLSPHEVFDRLCQIIVDQLGVRPDEVVSEARFIEDLGMS